MQVLKATVEQLRHDFEVMIPAQEIDDKCTKQLKELQQRIRIPGFRPGKVPMATIRQRHESEITQEVINEIVSQSAQKVIEENALRPAMQGNIKMNPRNQGEDLQFTLSVEVFPEITLPDFTTITLEHLVAKVSDHDVEKQIAYLVQVQRSVQKLETPRPTQQGDCLLIDHRGFHDDHPIDQLTGKDVKIWLGEDTLGLGSDVETQLLGILPVCHRKMEVTLPHNKHFGSHAGETIRVEIDVKEIYQAVEITVDDDFAKRLGTNNLEHLQQLIKEQLTRKNTDLSSKLLKRKLLDYLEENHKFLLPQGMVDHEFDLIWQRLQEEKNLDADEDDKSDSQLRDEYQQIARRRIHLGLLLAEISRQDNIVVTQEEVDRTLMTYIYQRHQNPKEIQTVFKNLKNQPEVIKQIKQPLLEEKVITSILEKSKLERKEITTEELYHAVEDSDV